MKKFLFIILMVFPVLAFAKEYRVGIIASEGSAHSADMIRQEVVDFVGGQDSAVAQVYLYQPATEMTALDKLINDVVYKSDIMIYIGEVPAGRASQNGLLKPSVAVFDAKASCDADFESMVYTKIDYAEDMKVFRKLIGFEKLNVLASSYASCSSAMCKGAQKDVFKNINVPFEVIAAEDISGVSFGGKLHKGDALLVMEQPQLSAKEFKELMTRLADGGVKTFSFGGYYDAEQGVMAVNSRDKDSLKTARTVAVEVADIISGKKPHAKVEMKRNSGLVINLESATKASFSPSWHYMRTAELINFDKSIKYDKYIGYEEALHKAVTKNEDVASGKIDLATAKELVAMSKSAFRPTVSLETKYTRIDSDRAKVSSGMAPEKTSSVALKLQQILYSEEVFALVDEAKYRKQASEYMTKQVEMDIMQSAAKAYLQVLRARTYMNIALDNLDTTKSNYDLAKNRDMAGAASPADIYRWEATIALAKIDTVTAYNGVKSAMTELAKLISEDIDGFYDLENVTLDSHTLVGITADDGPLSNQATFEKFKKCMVDEAVKNSVELKTIKYLTESADREVLSARRKYYHPTLTLGGEYREYLSKTGEGDDTGADFYDDTDWSVAVVANLPLYEGGKRSATLSVKKSALMKMHHERSKVAKLVRQRMIVALENARASYDNYMLAGESAKAAAKTLELVSDLYSRGAVSITELIDAQNAKLKADMNEASNMYSFMEKIVDVERAFGGFINDDSKKEILKLINNTRE